MSAIQPEFEDETPFNPFDFWEGANFKLKIRNVEGYRNYDKSEFEAPSALFDGDDEALEKLWKSEKSLKALIEKNQFKTYEELKKKFDSIVSNYTAPKPQVSDSTDDDDPQFEVEKKVVHKKAVSDEDEDDLAMYAKLLES